jgi:GT2 family glycosyltransferase
MQSDKLPATEPLWCGQLELSAGEDLPVPAGRTHRHARVLTRLHGVPIGYADVRIDGLSISRAQIVQGLPYEARQRLAAHCHADGIDPDIDGLVGQQCTQPLPPTPPMSVVVATHGRGPALARCLTTLQRLDYPSLEVFIVDNAPPDGAAKAAFDSTVGGDDRFTYLVEPIKGASRARNTGLAASTGRIVAFTDDDVEVDPSWGRALATTFASAADIGCVTSLICSARLDTPAERYFDAKITWSDRLDPSTYRASDPESNADPLFPYAAGRFGAGAGVALTREVLDSIGGFDVALGPGTPARGGEDLDLFVRVILAGYALVYEPLALVWHTHRVDMSNLHQQMVSYGCGLSAYFTKYLRDPRSRGPMLRSFPAGVRHLVATAQRTRGIMDDTKGARRSLMMSEAKGFLAGPVGYVASQRALR